MKDYKCPFTHTHTHTHTHTKHTPVYTELFNSRWGWGGGGRLDCVEVFAEEVGFKVFFERENGIDLAEGGWEGVP